MRQFNTLFLAILISLTTNLQAQDFPYYISSTTAPYTDLQGATELTAGLIWDDPDISVQIGFDFDIFGQLFTELYFVGRGGELAGTSDVNSPHLRFSPYVSDLVDRGFGTTTSQSDINYKLEGTPGSRIFHLEWKNCGFYNEYDTQDSTNYFVNFQVRLYEGSNNIEIHFGPSFIGNSQIAHVGLSGPPIAFIENMDESGTYSVFDFAHLIVGAPTAPYADYITDIFQGYFGLSSNPVDGTVLVFSTTPTATREVNELEAALSVYPTIVDDFLQVNLNNEFDFKSGNIKVMNELGQFILKQILSNNHKTLDLSHLSAGAYFVFVQTENAQAVARVVKL